VFDTHCRVANSIPGKRQFQFTTQTCILVKSLVFPILADKMLSYRRETALQGTLVSAESGRLELRDDILLIL